MDIYWTLFIFICTLFYRVEITMTASLRTSEAVDVPESQYRSEYSDQPNYYMKRNVNVNRRPMSPHDKRHRQIYTSKTYFGRNQQLGLPRKHWNHKDYENTHFRSKTPRYMHPERQTPHQHISSAVHLPNLKPKLPIVPEYSARPDTNIVQVLSGNEQEASDETLYGLASEHDPNRRYEQNIQYDESNPQVNANPRVDHAQEYVNPGYVQYSDRPNFGYETDAVQRQYNGYALDLRHDVRAAHGPNYGHGSNARTEQDSASNPRYEHGHVVQHDTHTGNEQGPRYGSNVENGQNYNVHPGPENNMGYAIHEHQLVSGNAAVRVDHYGRPTHVQNGLASEQNFQDKKVLQNFEEEKTEGDNLKSEENAQKLKNVFQSTKIIHDTSQILSENNSYSSTQRSITSSTVSDSESISDETLAKEEIFRVLSDKNFRQQTPSLPATNELEGTSSSFSEVFEGSGSVENINEFMPTSDNESSKSARILEIFLRGNTTAECMTPKNESGICKGLSECPLLESMENFSSFLQYMCLQKSRLVGICCPDNPVVEISDPQENSTEQVKLDIQQPPDGCGVSTHTRIVGGTMSAPHEFSWMVALLRRGRFYCGGVIINNWYVLTAAHCVLGIKISDLSVRVGEFDFQQRTPHQLDLPVSEIKRHALFVTLTFQHDIALLKLRRRIEYSKFVGSICLPTREEGDFADNNATVVGWGTVSFGGAASPVLRQVTVPVWDNPKCDATYAFENINDAFLCAGSPDSGEDACQGDSGGPLMRRGSEGRWSVIGLVSWGRRCGDPTYPGVYTRVTSYLNWIAENAQ